MSLIADPRHTRADLRRWDATVLAALETTRTVEHQRRLDEARRAIDEFGSDGYVGVSWGKDSMVVGHLAQSAGLPLVWIRVHPIENPDCIAVAEASGWEYSTIERWCRWERGEWRASGTLEAGFAEARERFGSRHVSGVRAEESGTRKLTCMRNGTVSESTCRPLAWWTGYDVFGYLLTHDLPIHPAYAFTMRGLLDPCTIRVASLTGRRGTGMGREQWERFYYARRLAVLARGPNA